MKIEVPFNYQIYAFSSTRRGDENYTGTTVAEIREMSAADAEPAFLPSPHRQFGTYGRLNTPGEAVLRSGPEFLVPVSFNQKSLDASDLGDHEAVKATLAGLFSGRPLEEAKALSVGPRGIGGRSSAVAFDTMVKTRRGKPSLERLKSRYMDHDGLRHPLDEQVEEVAKFVGGNLVLVDGRLHLSTREPFFCVVRREKENVLDIRLTVADEDRSGNPHVYRMDEIDAFVDAWKAEGRDVRHDPVAVLRPDAFETRFEEARLCRSLVSLVGAVAAHGHRISRGDLETFLVARSARVGEKPLEEGGVSSSERLNAVAGSLSALTDLCERYGIPASDGPLLNLADMRRALDGYLATTESTLVFEDDEDLQAMFSGPATF